MYKFSRRPNGTLGGARAMGPQYPMGAAALIPGGVQRGPGMDTGAFRLVIQQEGQE